MTTTVCSGCAADFSRLRPQKRIFSSANEEFDFIRKETLRLDDIIRGMNEDRASLLRRRNEMQSSTRRLPPEILSCVFRHALTPLDFHTRDALRRGTNPSDKDVRATRFPLVLGGICSYWRQVAHSTPHLWTCIAARVEGETLLKQAEFLEFYIKHAGPNQSIDAEIDFEPASTLISHRPILTAVTRASSAFRVLSLNFPSKEWMTLLDRRFSRLTELFVGWPVEYEIDMTGNRDRDEDAIPFTALPRLTCVTFNNLASQVLLSWDKITTLRLFTTRINLCVITLLKCPNLIEFRCRWAGGDAPFSGAASQPSTTFTFPHLKIFEWSCVDHDDSFDLLRSIRLPALETLGLDQTYKSQDLWFVWHFLQAVCSKLKVLELTSFTHGEPDLRRVMRDLQNVERLYLRNCTSNGFKKVLKVLLSDSEEYIPKLKYMYVEGSSMRGDDSDNLSIPIMLLNMLEKRKHILNKKFCLELAEDYLIGWEFNKYELENAVLIDGWELEFYEGGELVDCLQRIYEKKRRYPRLTQGLEEVGEELECGAEDSDGAF